MANFRIALILLCILSVSIVKIHAQDPYFPPPSCINYHIDTLTIFPPDSLPGDPVVLLGYNIYVDSIFFDNVLVDNQTDTIDLIFDYSELYPGNHEFCVKTYYNQWISDPVCDTGLVIYGYELPFLEDWSSGNFTENNWTAESGNWTVDTEEGNQGPAAVFSGIPAQYNYEIPLESFAFRGDSMHVGRFLITFDIKLNSINNSYHESLSLQLWNWNDQYWETWIYFSNQFGSFGWTSQSINLNNASSSHVFKVRFLAAGDNSSDISSWMIDNIHISRNCLQSTSAQLEEHIDRNTLYWSPPTGCYPVGLEWGNGMYTGNSIGTGDEAVFDVAARWDAVQLNNYDGKRIRAVSFVPTETNANYRIRIWTGDSAENIVYDKAVDNPVIYQWNNVVLDTSIYIDATQDLWIGYHIETQTGYPVGVDDGPAIDGYGNMIYWQGAWQTLLEISPDLDYNWNINGVIYSYPGPPEIHFNIYRETNSSGYQFLAQTDDWIYEDYDINQFNLYCYKVTNIWTLEGDTCESAPTNEACEVIIGIDENDNDDKDGNSLLIYPNPALDLLHIECGETIEEIKIYSLLGELVSEARINNNEYVMNVSGFKEGMYYLEILGVKMKLNEKLIILH